MNELLKKQIDASVEDGNRRNVIIHLNNVCIGDITFESGAFEEGLQYAEKACEGKFELYDDFCDTPSLFSDRVEREDETINAGSFFDSLTNLEDNFCHERIEDTKILGEYLHAKQMDDFDDMGDSCGCGCGCGCEEEESETNVLAMALKIMAIVAVTVLVVSFLVRGLAKLCKKEEVKEVYEVRKKRLF